MIEEVRTHTDAPSAPRHATQRARLLGGMASSMAEKGYRQTRVSDVVRHARMSNRTFYEHFADKEDCLLALFEAGNEVAMRHLDLATDAHLAPREQIEASARAYFEALTTAPALTAAFVLEMAAAGGRARVARREAHDRFADRLAGLVRQGRAQTPHPGTRELTPALATIVVGGLHELMLKEVEAGRTAELPSLAPVVADIIWAVVSAPGRDPGRDPRDDALEEVA